MTEEEYQRIKEAEKERLRARKKLRALKKRSTQANTIQSALQRVKRGAETLLQRSSDLIDRLTHETAREEARLEMALDASTDEDPSTEARTLEDADREARAEALVQQLKMTAATRPVPSDASSPSASDENDQRDADDTLPEKTIGRMPRE